MFNICLIGNTEKYRPEDDLFKAHCRSPQQFNTIPAKCRELCTGTKSPAQGSCSAAFVLIQRFLLLFHLHCFTFGGALGDMASDLYRLSCLDI